MRRLSLGLALAAVLMGTACNQNVDLASIQKFTQAAADQQQPFADLAGDFYASCQRAHLWNLIASISPLASSSQLMPEQQRGLQIALQAEKNARRDLAAAIRAHNARAARAANTTLTNAKQQSASAQRNLNGAWAAARAQIDAADNPKVKAGGTAAPTAVSNGGAVAATPVPLATPTPVPPLQTVADTGDPCQLEADAADQWGKANGVLLGYVRALGDLAGAHDTTDNSYGFNDLAQQLSASETLTAGQTDTFKSAAAFMAQQIFAAKRREAIAQYAPQADAALQNWVNILESVANNNYRFTLRQERRNLNHFFEDNFQATQAGLPALQSLQYKTTWKDELAALDARTSALNAYVAALEALKKAHHAMVAQIARNDFSSFYAIVSGYVSETAPQIQKINKAFQVPAAAQKGK